MVEIRSGECLIESAGGSCCVCRKKILPGKAVQVSKWVARIRHVECMPKEDTRYRKGQGRPRKVLPD